MFFDVFFLNFNWFSGAIWVICPLFWSTPVPSRSILKVGTETQGNLGYFWKMDTCPRKWSTQACSKIIPELIRILRIKQNNCLKYWNRCWRRWGIFLGSATYGPSICYIYSGRWKCVVLNMVLCSNFMCIFLPTVLKWIYSEFNF